MMKNVLKEDVIQLFHTSLHLIESETHLYVNDISALTYKKFTSVIIKMLLCNSSDKFMIFFPIKNSQLRLSL